MKSILIALLLVTGSTGTAQNNLKVTLGGKDWNPKTVTAGVQAVMNTTAFTIIGENETERLDISIDYDAIKGKKAATFTFVENLMLLPGGSSISFAPKGLGKQQWVSAEGELSLTEFDEKKNAASGTFEATLVQMLDDKGGFVLQTPRPSMRITGSSEKVNFRKVD